MAAGPPGLFEVMERELSTRAFLAGDKPTLADVANYSYVARAPEGKVSLAIRWLRAWRPACPSGCWA